MNLPPLPNSPLPNLPRPITLAAALVVLGAILPVAAANPPEPPADEEYHARPRLISELTALIPGQTQWIGVHFEIEDGWHTYWPGINDSGFPASFEIQAESQDGHPVKIDTAPALWPTPHRHPYEGGLLDHVFEHEVTMLIPITLDEATTVRSVTLSLTGDWLVCEDECIPEYATLSIELPIAAPGTMVSRSADASLFDAARGHLPEPWPADDSAHAIHQHWNADTLTFHAGWAKRMAFYPSQQSREPTDLLTQGEAQGSMLKIGFRPDEQGQTPVAGVLEVWPETGGVSRVYKVRTPP